MLGKQTVKLGVVTQTGAPGFLGIKSETRTDVTVSGCRGRVLSATETAELQTDVATEIWKWTLPAAAAAATAKSTGELVYDGTATPARTAASVFQIDGPIQPKYNMDGTLHHVTLMAKRQAG